MTIHKGNIHHKDIAPKTEPVNASTFFKCDHCDFKRDNKSCVKHLIETTHDKLQCHYYNFNIGLKFICNKALYTLNPPHPQVSYFSIESFI